LTGCFLILATGSIVDRLGIRRSSLVSLLLWTAVFLLLANGEFFCEKISANGLNRQLFFAAFLYLCLSILRFFGQNMLPMLGRVQIVKTFDGRQGTAIAVSGVLVSITVGLAPRMMHFLANGDDWQGAYGTLAMVSFGAFIVFFLFFRDVDSSSAEFAKKREDLKKSLEIITRRELLREPIFWCITLTLCINAFIGSGTMVHIADIFRENGICSRVARNSQLYLCCASALVGPLFGKLVDGGKIKSCVLAILCVQFFGLVGLEFTKSTAGFLLYIVCLGGSWGGYGVLRTAAWSKIFGVKNIGSILGLIYFCSAIAGAVSVSLMSFSKELFGSYFHLMHLTECVIAAMALLVIRKFPTKV
jgi:Na+/melibiose symporter-like transporter